VCCSLSWILHLATQFVDPAAKVHQSCSMRMALWGQKHVCTRLYLKYISARTEHDSLCGYLKWCIKVVNKSQTGSRSLSRDSCRIHPEYGTRMDDGLLLTGCDHSLPNRPKFETLKTNMCQLSFKYSCPWDNVHCDPISLNVHNCSTKNCLNLTLDTFTLCMRRCSRVKWLYKCYVISFILVPRWWSLVDWNT